MESVVTAAELTGEMSQQAACCRDSTNTGGPWDPGLAKSHASSRFTLGFPALGECKYCAHLAEGLLPYLRIRRNRQTPYPLIVSVPSSIHIFFLLCLREIEKGRDSEMTREEGTGQAKLSETRAYTPKPPLRLPCRWQGWRDSVTLG